MSRLPMPRPVTPSTVEGLVRTASTWLGPDARVRAAPLDSPAPPLPPDEATAVAAAIEKRKREFGWGRSLARGLLREIGLEPPSIPRADNRAPVWPSGAWGSITHTDELVLVGVEPLPNPTFGLDLEGSEPLGADYLDYILRPEERLAIGEDASLAKVVFSGKEAFYKAQHVHTEALLDFLEVRLELDSSTQSFEVVVDHPAKAKLKGRCHGRWGFVGPFVLSVAWVED